MKVTDARIKRLIHESNLIEGYDDRLSDFMGVVAWRYLEALDTLAHSDIAFAQHLVTLHQDDLQPSWRGNYRDVSNERVQVGGHEVVAPKMVPAYMENWLLDYQTVEPIAMHIRFEKIHPFVDGNGRTGRLLLWWMQLKRGEPLTEITYEKRNEYYEWFK